MIANLIEKAKNLFESEANTRLHLIIAESVSAELSDEQAASVLEEISGRRNEKFASQLRDKNSTGAEKTRKAFRAGIDQTLGSYIWSKAKE